MPKLDIQSAGATLRDALITVLQELRQHDRFATRFVVNNKDIKVIGSYSDEADQITIVIKWRN